MVGPRALELSILGLLTDVVSRLDVEGKTFDSRIQGGLLADGLNGIFAGLATITPMSTYAQNNGKRPIVSPTVKVLNLNELINSTAGVIVGYALN